MKKAVLLGMFFCLVAVLSTNVFANAYLNFAGIGSNALSNPFTLTTCSGPVNCTPNPVLTNMTVSFSAVGGSGGSCQKGFCSGTATSVFETFSTPAVAFALFSAPTTRPTTVTYLLNGHLVGPTQNQLGGMYNLQQSAHTVFDTVEFTWAKPTDYKFYQGTFDAVPEPSSLVLLGSGLLGLMGIARRKLFR